MPHQCTNCGRTFPDGSKEMLSGCPDCGGNKFQFAPSSAAQADTTAQANASGVDSGDSNTPPDPPSNGSTDSVAARAAETVRDFVSTETDPADTETDPVDRSNSTGKASSQSETGPETTTSTRSGEEQPTHGIDTQQTTDASQSSTPNAANSSATRDETDRETASEKPVQNTASEWTTASDSKDVPSSSGEFPEWPDSARPPEDRSTADSDLEDSSDSASTTGPQAGQRSEPSDIPSEGSPSASGSPSTDRETEGTVTERTDPQSADSEPIDSQPTEPEETGTDRIETDPIESEDIAQASARSDVVQSDELPNSTAPIEDATAPDHGRVVSEPTGEQPSLEDLRAELNEQFESIKILKPGQYELNLMELYNREEYIISLQEDGRYVIDVPDSWRDGSEE